MKELAQGFRAGLEDLDKNEILVSNEDKNEIMDQLIVDQVAENNHFVIPPGLYGDDTCDPCHGLGHKMFFDRTLSVRTCLKCDHGKKTIPCTKCTNGRYIRETGGNLKLNVLCKFCQGTKRREVKCKTCRGTGELRKMVITPKIKSITPCKHCRGLGFIDEKLFAIIDDTAKFEDAAEDLLAALIPVEEDLKADNEEVRE